jgi:CheY-like chemotaxis protein
MANQLSILVIDDTEDELLLMERLLLRVAPSITVDSAAGGEKGLARLQSGGALPVLTLLDLKMAGLSGIDTLRRIRADEKLRYLPVAVVTNSALESDEKEAMEAGADAFLHKTLDIDHFCNELKLLLDRFSRE